jgi:hypothetical protein
MRRALIPAAALIFAAGVGAQQPPPPAAPPAQPERPGAGVEAAQSAAQKSNFGSDANGNPLRLALRTGHVSNYDEAKVGPVVLPDPLRTSDGRRVGDAGEWAARRLEIKRIYETEIYGRIPPTAPKVTWAVAEREEGARDGASTRTRVVGTIGDGAGAPRINLTLHTPARSRSPVPLILLVNFGGGPPRPGPAGRGRGFPTDPPVAAEILGRGWGYATVGYQDIQPDRAGTFKEGVIGDRKSVV